MTARASKSFFEKTTPTAVILCGGRGDRLRPLTDAVPKPLLLVNGRPLLAYLLELLARSGIREFLLCIGYKAELFEQFARQRASGPERIRCLNAGDVGITARLAAARPLIGDRALICYADTLADVDLTELTRVHEARGVHATLTVRPYQSPFGIVTFKESGLVSRFVEKPALPYWINIGFLLLESPALAQLQPDVSFPDFLAGLAAEGRLGVYQHLGRHWTANTRSELHELAAGLREHWNLQKPHGTATP